MANTHNHKTHEHAHCHGHCHSHGHGQTKNKLLLATAILFVFSIIEAGSGWWSNSLTLLSDAGHMAADGLAMALAAFAAWIAKRPISDKHTYGLGRAEVIAAWLSSISLVIITIVLLVEAIHRFHVLHEIQGRVVMLVAFIGLATNLLIAWILGQGESTINTKAALLHVISDVLGSIIALISGAIIYFTGWVTIDPILSIAIAILILLSTINLLRESFVILMEGVPKHIDTKKVEIEINKIDDVLSNHDLHIWTVTTGMIMLSVHVVIPSFDKWPIVTENLKCMLLQKFGISHATMQPEVAEISTCEINCGKKK